MNLMDVMDPSREESEFGDHACVPPNYSDDYSRVYAELQIKKHLV